MVLRAATPRLAQEGGALGSLATEASRWEKAGDCGRGVEERRNETYGAVNAKEHEALRTACPAWRERSRAAGGGRQPEGIWGLGCAEARVPGLEAQTAGRGAPLSRPAENICQREEVTKVEQRPGMGQWV